MNHGYVVPTVSFASMRAALVPRGTAPVVRLSIGPAAYFSVGIVQAALDEAESRCAQAASGLDTLTPLEILAIHLLHDSAQAG